MSEPPLEIAARIAREVRAAGGRALIVGGWVRDRLIGQPSKDVDIEVFGIDAEALRTLLGTIGPGQHGRRELHRLQGRRPRRLAAADANPRSDAAIAGSPSPGIRGCRPVKRRAGATSRSTPSPGIRSPTSTSIRSTDGRTSSAGCSAPSTGRPSRDDSLRVLRAIQFAARFELDASSRAPGRSVAAFRSTICRPSGSGERSTSCCSGRNDPRSASPSRSISASSSGCFRSWTRWSAARRSRSGIRKGTSGSTRCS